MKYFRANAQSSAGALRAHGVYLWACACPFLNHHHLLLLSPAPSNLTMATDLKSIVGINPILKTRAEAASVGSILCPFHEVRRVKSVFPGNDLAEHEAARVNRLLEMGVAQVNIYLEKEIRHAACREFAFATSAFERALVEAGGAIDVARAGMSRHELDRPSPELYVAELVEAMKRADDFSRTFEAKEKTGEEFSFVADVECLYATYEEARRMPEAMFVFHEIKPGVDHRTEGGDTHDTSVYLNQRLEAQVDTFNLLFTGTIGIATVNAVQSARFELDRQLRARKATTEPCKCLGMHRTNHIENHHTILSEAILQLARTMARIQGSDFYARTGPVWASVLHRVERHSDVIMPFRTDNHVCADPMCTIPMVIGAKRREFCDEFEYHHRMQFVEDAIRQPEADTPTE